MPQAPRQSRVQRFFKSIVSVDAAKHTVTLPLHRGVAKGETVWYVVTDASDVSGARKEGV
jgi:hypothetical protein